MAATRMKDRHPSQRPRERLWQLGAAALSDEELLAILLGSGTAGDPASGLAQRLLSEGLGRLSTRGPRELARLKGIGPAKAAVLRSAFELGRRAFREEGERPRCSVAADVYRIVRPHIDPEREELFVLCVDTRARLVALDRATMGGSSWTPADPKDVFRRAVREGAQAIWLAHNHPSGVARPSPADVEATRRLAACGEILGIRLVDHLVIAHNGYVSVRQYMRLDPRKEPVRV